MTEQTCHMCGCPKPLWAIGDESERDYKAELAAPDLLAALEGCEAYLTEYQRITKSTLFDLSQARTAIAKARKGE